VEKPFVENENDEWYELIKCEINNEDFKQEIEKLKKGDIVGIKGRIQSYKNFQNILSERIQIF
jgi:single-stranded DNA-binding protein